MAVSWHGLLDASVDIEALLLRHPELTPLQRDTLIKLAEDADPRLENSFETLIPLIIEGEAALEEWLATGDLSDETAARLGTLAWLAINTVPLDLVDELEIAFVVCTARHHASDLEDALEGAKRVSLGWYEGFWPFEHPEAVAQAARFGNLANHLPAPVFMADTANRVTFSSYELDELLGVPQGSVERFLMSDLFDIELKVGADSPTDVTYERNGSLHHLRVTVLPTETAEGTEYFGFVHDRTREVALEQMRDGVVGAISHELRTPLTAVIGFLDLLRSGSLPPEDWTEALDIMHAESELLLRLVGDIVDFSKLSAGTAVMRIEEFPLLDAVHTSIRRAQIDEAAVLMDVPPTLSVFADRDRVEQLLTNLLTNARRYGGPEVRIQATRIFDGVELVVHDDGPGIPGAELETIFDPFVQGSMRHTGDGAGLGLAICAGIMQSMGGTLSVENDGGARFTARLPTA